MIHIEWQIPRLYKNLAANTSVKNLAKNTSGKNMVANTSGKNLAVNTRGKNMGANTKLVNQMICESQNKVCGINQHHGSRLLY